MSDATATLFEPLTIATAPEASKPILEKIQKSFGFIPNLMANFANSPTVLEGYMTLESIYEKGTFRPAERQLILLAASLENGCDYCIAAHSTVLRRFLKAPSELVDAVRANSPVADPKQNALVKLVREIVRERGHASKDTVDGFLAAGYSRDQVMELLLGVALKTISNYLDHLSPTKIDAAFASAEK